MSPTLEPKPKRIQRTRKAKLPAGAVVVTRPTKFGNPFTVEQHGRAVAVELFHVHLGTNPELQAAARAELRGRDLACWCPVDGEPCHADVLLELANAPDTPT